MVEVNELLAGYLLFGLVLIRCSGVAVFAPFFGAEQFPLRARIGLVFFFALLLYPAATQDPACLPRIPNPLNMLDLGILTLQEVSVGVVLGFLSTMVFMGTQLGGQLVGQQVGFAMANVIDPLSDSEVSLIGFLNMNLAVVIFVTANLHLLVIGILWKSYGCVPIGALAFAQAPAAVNQAVMVESERMFVVALQLAMPVLLVMLLNSVVEGFVTRTMPQMNIMVLGLPLRVALGMTALVLTLPAICYALDDGTGHSLEGENSGILSAMLLDLADAVALLGR